MAIGAASALGTCAFAWLAYRRKRRREEPVFSVWPLERRSATELILRIEARNPGPGISTVGIELLRPPGALIQRLGHHPPSPPSLVIERFCDLPPNGDPRPISMLVVLPDDFDPSRERDCRISIKILELSDSSSYKRKTISRRIPAWTSR